MRTGSCKFGASCKFNHPDPTSAGGYNSPSGYGNGSSISLQDVSQSSTPSWSSTRKLNEPSPFVPIIISPSPGASPRNSDWNGYQAPFYLSEKSVHPPSQYAVNSPTNGTDVYIRRHKQMQMFIFAVTRLPPCNLSDKDLPLRPGQIVCTRYSRYGICKFGPACKFDHPINLSPPTMPGLYQQSSHTNSASVEEAESGDTTNQ